MSAGAGYETLPFFDTLAFVNAMGSSGRLDLSESMMHRCFRIEEPIMRDKKRLIMPSTKRNHAATVAKACTLERYILVKDKRERVIEIRTYLVLKMLVDTQSIAAPRNPVEASSDRGGKKRRKKFVMGVQGMESSERRSRSRTRIFRKRKRVCNQINLISRG